MIGSTARKYYLGQGVARLGCAQAVAEALRESLDKKAVIEDHFRKVAGAVTCREIRANGKLMCADCVEHAANLLG